MEHQLNTSLSNIQACKNIFTDIYDFFYIYSGSCLIDEGESFLLTGGYGAMNDGTVSTVSRYDLNGWVEDLDDLNTKRFGHGCTQYLNTDRAKVWKHIFMMINLLYLLI